MNSLIRRSFLAALLVGSSLIAAVAQQTTTSGGVVIIQQYSGPPAPPPPRPETPDSGPSLGKEGARPYSVYRNYPPAHGRDRGPRPLGPFFLPPILPVLGIAPPANPMPLASGYPREFVGEPFFMAYGNLVANNLLSAKRIERINRYRSARLSLLVELRAQLSRVPKVSPEGQQRVLADFAAEQTPRLLELEVEAEEIRYELTRVELFSTPADDIGDLRSIDRFEGRAFVGAMALLDLSDEPNRPKESPEISAARENLRLLLSSVYFRDGFSPEQRRLLEEMAFETELVIEPDTGSSVFFWPAGARIPVPTGLTSEAKAKWEEFQRHKAALKDELRTTLAREEKHIFNIDSTEAYKHLAAAQAPRFAELDTLADQIRPALAALADADTRLAAEFPANLAQQITSLAARKAVLQRELRARLDDFRLELPTERIELIRQGNGLALAVVTTNSSARDIESVLGRIKSYNEEIAGRFTALATLRDQVRDGLTRYQATAPGLKPGITVDQLAADFLTAYQAREIRNRQRDYAAAVLTPGLSPAQRRLLLTAAQANFLEESGPPTP